MSNMLTPEPIEKELLSGHGRSGAKIMLVADYGTKADVQNRECISGNDRKTLQSLFLGHKLNLNNCYLTAYIKDGLSYYGKAKNVLKKAISDAEEGILPLSYESILKEEIQNISPNIIVPLGDISLKKLTDVNGITNFRGSILPIRADWQIDLKRTNIRIMPILGPQFINQNWALRPISDLDIAKIAKYEHRTDTHKEDYLIWIAKNAEELHNFLDRQYAKKPKYLVFDIETIKGIPDCISFCFDGYESVCIPLLLNDTIDMANKVLMWRLVARVLKSNIPKVNQNIKYDWKILERFGFTVNNIIGDTALRAGVIYPELKKNLGFLVSIYTEMPYFKDEGKDFDISKHDRSRRYLYNAKDSLGVHRIHEAQEAELDEFDVRSLYEKKIMPLFFIYKKIDDVGILIDDSIRKKLRNKYEKILEMNLALLENLTCKKINVLSYKQVGALLFNDMKFPERKHQTDSGEDAFSTDEDVLEELLAYHGSDSNLGERGKLVLEIIIGARKFDKVLQTIDTVIHPDGRLRGIYNLTGTNTGRTSMNQTLDELFFVASKGKDKGKIVREQIGRSLQTISKHGFKFRGEYYGKDLRDMFVSSPGYVFVENDLSQAEARYIAVLSEDYDLLKAFDMYPGTGYVHRLTASWVFDKHVDAVKQKTEEYQIGKTVRHAGNLDIGEFRLAQMLNIDITLAKKLLIKFHAASPKTRENFQREVKNFTQHNRFLINAFGRRRDFFKRVSGNFFKEAFAFLPQSTISDQNKFAMIPMGEALDKYNTHRFVYEGHDALMSEVKKGEEERYIFNMKGFMETPIDCRRASISRDIDLVIPTEFETGESWGAMKKYEI